MVFFFPLWFRPPAPGEDRRSPGRLGTGPLRPRVGGGAAGRFALASPPPPRESDEPPGGQPAFATSAGGPGALCLPIARRRGWRGGGSSPPRARGALSCRQPGGGSFTKFYSLFLIRANFYINGTCKRVRLPPVQTKGGRSLPGEKENKPGANYLLERHPEGSHIHIGGHSAGV